MRAQWRRLTPANRKLITCKLPLADDRAEILALLTQQGIALQPTALDFAASQLSEDWLVAWVMWASAIFNIRTEKYKFGVWLATWAEIVSTIFDIKNVAGIGEQIRRSEEHTSELQSLRHLVCRLL